MNPRRLKNHPNWRPTGHPHGWTIRGLKHRLGHFIYLVHDVDGNRGSGVTGWGAQRPGQGSLSMIVRLHDIGGDDGMTSVTMKKTTHCTCGPTAPIVMAVTVERDDD